MADFGLIAIPTHYTITPVELARWAEDQGFESVWFGEHSHIPTSRKTPFPLGGDLPVYYKEFFDPFVGLSAAAAVTTKLKVGTSVCLVPEHNTMNLAKMVSCLDQVSKGRFLFGIGAGWNAEEMADHGVELKDRWKVTRERILAVGIDLAGAVEAIRSEAALLGRTNVKFDLTACTGFELASASAIEARIPELVKIGFNRIAFLTPVGTPDKQWPILERYSALMRKFA
jgi:alkanesulfonate monooxygenase SsuD/methylene tetrahydromethanopterin reductase-like flavin-dependent oxidoreductase (luciferase family)